MKYDPSFDLLGSYFPSWMMCLVAGIVTTLLVRFVLHRVNWEKQLAPPVLIYPSMAAFFCFSLWLIFFSGR